MKAIRFTVAVLLSLFSTVIMSYIALAASIGPWIETTLVLISMLIFYPLTRILSAPHVHSVGLTTVAGGIGGILATGMAFSLPTLYFLDAALFQSWLQNPWFFVSALALFALSAGSFGLMVAHFFEHTLIDEQQMHFPIGELVYNTIAAQGQFKKAIELGIGFITTQLFLYIHKATRVLGSTLTVITTSSWSLFTLPAIAIPLNQLPLYLAVGFVTGHVIALPLAVGFLTNVLVIEPLFKIYTSVGHPLHQALQTFIRHPHIERTEFIFSFCSGIVLFGALQGFIELGKSLKTWGVNFSSSKHDGLLSGLSRETFKKIPLLQTLPVIALNVFCLRYFNFSWLTQLYLMVFTAICIWQMLIIAGKIGIVPLGRFATFVMVPSMLLFNVNPIQITLIAAFVEIAGGVAGDSLFGRKMGRLAGIASHRVARYQWLGLLVSSLAIGAVFLLFINHFGLGLTSALPATKAASRALLINFKTFDSVVLILGLVVGYLLTFTKINAALLLGGILMPPQISLMLVAGGMLTVLTKNKESWFPLMSGVSAGNSLWMLLEVFTSSGRPH